MPQLPEMVKVLLLGRVNFEGSNAFGFSAISRVSKNVYLTGGFGYRTRERHCRWQGWRHGGSAIVHMLLDIPRSNPI